MINEIETILVFMINQDTETNNIERSSIQTNKEVNSEVREAEPVLIFERE